MLNLVALVLVATTSLQQAAPAGGPPHAREEVRSAPGPAAPKLTEKQKAWFAHAVDHILEGR